ncbi:uncharacterized protein TNCV_5109851 [Trichonephila clavipes]|nr:uncharacterized protein TNCV_5109851 [Trichonephila clavipes]
MHLSAQWSRMLGWAQWALASIALAVMSCCATEFEFSLRTILLQDNTRLCFGARAAGVHYHLFSVWTLVPIRLGKQWSGYTTVDEIVSVAADCRLIYTMANCPQRRCQVIYSQFGLAIHQNGHQARRRFVEWGQNEIAVVPDFHKRILFSDEAHFWLNGYVNKQNCRIWSKANPQVYVETPLHPEKLTVWCALWAGEILLQKR